MRRREFLKSLAALPIAGPLMVGKTEKKPPPKDEPAQKFAYRQYNLPINEPFIGITLEDIPKDGCGWVQVNGVLNKSKPRWRT